jgi:hypothetical protein
VNLEAIYKLYETRHGLKFDAGDLLWLWQSQSGPLFWLDVKMVLEDLLCRTTVVDELDDGFGSVLGRVRSIPLGEFNQGIVNTMCRSGLAPRAESMHSQRRRVGLLPKVRREHDLKLTVHDQVLVVSHDIWNSVRS